MKARRWRVDCITCSVSTSVSKTGNPEKSSRNKSVGNQITKDNQVYQGVCVWPTALKDTNTTWMSFTLRTETLLIISVTSSYIPVNKPGSVTSDTVPPWVLLARSAKATRLCSQASKLMLRVVLIASCGVTWGHLLSKSGGSHLIVHAEEARLHTAARAPQASLRVTTSTAGAWPWSLLDQLTSHL